MIKKHFVVGALGTNCYLIADEDKKLACFIDPGDDASKLIAYIEQSGYKLEYILLTHAHHDHTGALDALTERWDVPVYLHKADAEAKLAGLFYQGKKETTPVSDGDELTLGSIKIKVLSTPGHSEGSCVYMVGNDLYTGDTLFAGSCGRVDFPGGNGEKMLASLKRLSELEGDYNIYPGHMSFSTMERERMTNYYMRSGRI